MKLSAELNNFNKLELKLILLKGVVLWYNRKPDLRLLITQVLKKFFASELWVGRVVINGKVAKASADVKAGDVIEIAFGNKSVKVRVTDVKDTVKKEEAADMFEYL